MKKIISLGFIVLTFFMAKAQSSKCFVGLDSLKGSYEGDCRDGKANGDGKAYGIDSYEGIFKSGLPEGKGKYTWKNGDYYYGSWKKGQKDGKGELHLEDTVIYGYWKKGVYKGKYENPYVIHNSTTEVGRVEVNKIRGGQSNVAISVQNLIGLTSMYNSPLQTLTRLTDFKVLRGTYQGKSTSALTNKEITTFQAVTFPFRIYLYYNASSVEIEFFEDGSWDVMVPINK